MSVTPYVLCVLQVRIMTLEGQYVLSHMDEVSRLPCNGHSNKAHNWQLGCSQIYAAAGSWQLQHTPAAAATKTSEVVMWQVFMQGAL